LPRSFPGADGAGLSAWGNRAALNGIWGSGLLLSGVNVGYYASILFYRPFGLRNTLRVLCSSSGLRGLFPSAWYAAVRFRFFFFNRLWLLSVLLSQNV